MAKRVYNLYKDMEESAKQLRETIQERDAMELQVEGTVNDTQASEPNTKTGSRVGENDPTVPDVKFKRNITLSEEMLWRLNYIKERKNKNRAKGDKFVTIDQLMFEMVKFALDEKFGSTKKKFIESKEDEEDFL